MPQDLTDHLQAAAAHVAQTLVVRELEKLARGGAITVTVHADAAPAPQKLLGAGRKKPGPKPKLTPTSTPAPATEAGPALVARKCPVCHSDQIGLRPGTTTASCRACKHTWEGRLRRTGAPTPAPKPTERPAAGNCTRCDHPLARHVEFTGECLIPRCVCAEAVEP